MRIAFIATSEVPSRTANSIQVMKVCDAFKTLGHEVKLYLPGTRSKTAWESLQSHYGISSEFSVAWLRSIRLLRRYDFAFKAVRSGRQWRADYFYVWTLQAAAFASQIGYPTILEMHDRPPGRFGPVLFRWYMRGKGAIRLLPITHSLRDWLSGEYQIELSDSFTKIAPMGVDVGRYSSIPEASELRKELDLHGGFTAGYSGHLYPGRGMDILLELARRNSDINFVWIGGEPDSVKMWKRKSTEMSLENLQILGFVENERVPRLQSACDVLLMPYQSSISISSGGDTAKFASPMKAFEYLASGKAIISSDLPVLQEILNESNSILLPPEDVDAWERTLRELMVDNDRREVLGKSARRDASRFTWAERARMSLENLPE
jgi:glycosyltransferase involved in cell wall biosynthesis